MNDRAPTRPTLAIFDLDHTLLDGDSDQLWCSFLIDEGVLDGARFAARNAQMEQGYRDGTVSVQAFCDFYIGTLAGRSPAQWQPLRDRFVQACVLPRLHAGARGLLDTHRRQGHRLLLSTATNRFLTEPTAAALGVDALIGTECELGADGCFTGRALGLPNMRDGKVARLQAWLAAQGQALADLHTVFYSDSMNDLPLLEQVTEAVVTHGEPRLQALAAQRGWRCISLEPKDPR
ncbi:MAG: HAD family hydrolase [Rubrivivax sp.]